MKQNLVNIPEVGIEDVNAFYVVGSTHKDGILGNENYKLNLKSLGGGGGIDLNDRAALKALYYAMMDALTLVVITEDMCVYNDNPGSADRGGYTVTVPKYPSELPAGLNPIIAVSGLFKDIAGNTHSLETLKLVPDDEDPVFRGSWMESDTRYNLILSFTSSADMSTARLGIIPESPIG